MSTDTAQERNRRIHELYATDAEFAAARPDEVVGGDRAAREDRTHHGLLIGLWP